MDWKAKASLWLLFAVLWTAANLPPSSENHIGGCPSLALDPRECWPDNATYQLWHVDHNCCCLDLSDGATCAAGDLSEGLAIECDDRSSFAEFPKIAQSPNLSVVCLEIKNGKFSELTKDHLSQFPSLRSLILENGILSRIDNDAFEATPELLHLNLENNLLTVWPRVAGLDKLITLLVPFNMIQSLEQTHLAGAISVTTIRGDHNDIRRLDDYVFRDQCNLQFLNLGHNPNLDSLGSEAFADTRIEILDLSHTKISRLPHNFELRESLEELYLEGTRRLTRIDLLRNGDLINLSEANLTFPLLEKVEFYKFYSAHCCQLEGHPPVKLASRVSCPSKRSIEWDEQEYPVERVRRDSLEPLVCVNITAGIVVDNSEVDTSRVEIQTEEEICAMLSAVNCLEDVCPEGCGSGVASGSGTLNTNASSEIVCVQRTFTPTPSSCYSPTFMSQINRTMCSTLAFPTPTPTSTSTVTPSPSPPDPCDCVARFPNDDFDREFCEECREDLCGHEPVCDDEPFAGICSCNRKRRSAENKFEVKRHERDVSEHFARKPVRERKRRQLPETSPCIVEVVDVVCQSSIPCPTATLSSTTPVSSSTISPVTTPPPPDPCDCVARFPNDDFDQEFCEECREDLCGHEPVCDDEPFAGICSCNRKRRSADYIAAMKGRPPLLREQQLRSVRSTAESSENSTTYSTLPEGWFRVSPDVICMDVITTTPTTSTPTAPTPTAPTPSSIPNTVQCVKKSSPNFKCVDISDTPTVCLPRPNDFNPCEDLLGFGRLGPLRVLIWLVIAFALVGNFIVIFVVGGYYILLRRIKKDVFVIHFLYVNLAVADFLMGVYLFTIAVEDLKTFGNFAFYDIEWRLGHGCRFAGFCAITSTVVSVYTLVVITLERLYTIVNVMKQQKSLNRVVIYVIMGVGWVIGIVMGILPMVGVSTYSAVAICLPFDVSTTAGRGYVSFLLIATGVAFLVIAVSYVVIFYRVFLSRSRRRLMHSTNLRQAWKTQLKVGFRMTLLVVTNFVCWFPIALLALWATYGTSPIDVSTSKYFMVIVFPVNACLNPILYSVSTRTFWQNSFLLLGKCGLFKDYSKKISARRVGMDLPSSTSQTSTTNRGGRRNTLVQRLFSSQGSRMDISVSQFDRRRDSAMSQDSLDGYRNLLSRRASNFSSGSDEPPHAGYKALRRGSGFSNGSLEDPSTTFANAGYRSSSPTASSPLDGRLEVVNRAKQKISASSLDVLHEENEVPIAPTPVPDSTVTLNPAYCDAEEEERGSDKIGGKIPNGSDYVTMMHMNGVVDDQYLQHHIITEALEGQTSESPGSEDAVEMTVLATHGSQIETESLREEMTFD